MKGLRKLLVFNLRLLCFRITKEEFSLLSRKHLFWGLGVTWLVGIGRWWDDPGASLLQHFGLGSLVYVLVLSAIIYLLVWPLITCPLKAREWSYKHVLTFVSLTSLPGALYAIPVERFLSVEVAITMNVWFLGIVAAWRVTLYLSYLIRHATLHWFAAGIVWLLPLSAIVSLLFVLNLHRVVFNIMGGLRDAPASPHDGEYAALSLLTMLSFFAFIPLIIGYLSVVFWTRSKRREGNK